MAKKTITDGTVADAYLQILADRGVEYFFGNAGTDFAPIVEAFAKAQALNTPVPEPITVPHENTAVHMAMGYYFATGKPQAVMVHVNVGTANGLNGLLNASRGQIPVFFTAGRTPTNEEDLPGHRSLDIHWTQEMYDQAGMVREAVKWDYELRNAEQVETVVDRGLSIAMSEPKGPVYLSLPREVLADPVETFSYNSPTRQSPASAPWPDRNAVDEIATLLAKAENPLILTGTGGRTVAAWDALSDLAERYAIPVVQHRFRLLSLATNHPMNMGYVQEGWVSEADVIVVVDTAAPYVPTKNRPRDDCKVIHIGADPLHSYVPIRGIPADIALTCGTAAGLTAIGEALETHSSSARDRIEARRKRLAVRQQALHGKWAEQLEAARHKPTITSAWLSHCISEVKDDDAVMLQEARLTTAQMHFDRPMSLWNAGAASGLGHGLGAALGIKMALPDRQVIGVHGDGAYMFGNPVSAHYVAAEQGLAHLTVILNNGRWQAVRGATVGLNGDGYAAASNRQPLTFLDAIDGYEKVVESAGGYGEKVTDPADVLAALERGLRAVEVEKRQAVINMICTTD